MERGEGYIARPTFEVEMSHQNQAKPLQESNIGKYIEEREQHYVPITNVTRIMRRVLPPYAKISDESKETMQDCVTKFVWFMTDEANQRCKLEHRKTITAEDVLTAMANLGFKMYVGPLTTYLNRYRLHTTGGTNVPGQPTTRMVKYASGPADPVHRPVFPMAEQPMGVYGEDPEAKVTVAAETSGGGLNTGVEQPLHGFNNSFGPYA